MGRKKYDIDFVKKYCKKRDIEVLDNKYINSETKMDFRCMVCRYEWETEFRVIKNNGSGCPQCAGNVKYTMEEVKKYCKNKNIEVLSKKYINANTKMNFKCMICNYEWETNFNCIKNNNTGCSKCVGNLKYTIEEVKKYCKNRNIEVLDKQYINISHKMNFRCVECDHKWQTSFGCIKNGDTGCPKCVGLAKYTLNEVKNYCKYRNIEILDNEYINNGTKMNFKCMICDYNWSTKFSHIKYSGSGCPKCSYKKLSEEKSFDYSYIKKICESKNIEVLDGEYKNANSKISVQCMSCSYKWQVRFNCIKNRGHGCPKCAGVIKYTLDEVKKHCEQKGINVLSNKYINANSKLQFLCEKCNNKFSNTFSHIKNRNQGCPNCLYKSEAKFRKTIEGVLDAKFPKRRPKWLLNGDGNRLELDGYNEDLKIAFEYQGEQHFLKANRHTKISAYKVLKIQKHDLIKKELCEKQGVILLCPTYELDQSEYERFIKQNLDFFNDIN